MLKLRSDRSLITEFNGHIQKQLIQSSLIYIVLCQMKLNMRSKRSVIFQFLMSQITALQLRVQHVYRHCLAPLDKHLSRPSLVVKETDS